MEQHLSFWKAYAWTLLKVPSLSSDWELNASMLTSLSNVSIWVKISRLKINIYSEHHHNHHPHHHHNHYHHHHHHYSCYFQWKNSDFTQSMLPHRGASNEYNQQRMFSWRNMKSIMWVNPLIWSYALGLKSVGKGLISNVNITVLPSSLLLLLLFSGTH